MCVCAIKTKKIIIEESITFLPWIRGMGGFYFPSGKLNQEIWIYSLRYTNILTFGRSRESRLTNISLISNRLLLKCIAFLALYYNRKS